MIAGSIEIQLMANLARLQSDLNKATRSVDGAMSSIEKSVGFAQKALLGLGVGISFAALIGQVNKAVDTLAKLDDMAQKTGSSVETLSKLQKVAVQFGQDFGAVDTAISKLSKGLAGIDDAGGKTAKALNAIGISQKFVKDNDPSQVLVQVAKNLQNYQDGASKAALATDLFGKAGVEILPYLNDLAENVDKFSGSSAKAAAEAAALQDRIGGFKVKIDEATTSITTALLPAFDQIITKFTEAVKEGGLLLGIIKSIGEIGKISLFGTDRSKQENMYATTLPNAMAQIGRELKDQNLTSQERIKKQVELNFLAKEYNALAIQLGKAEKASPYVNPQGDKPKLGYMGEEAEKALAAARTSAAKEAEAARKKTNDEILKDIQKQIDFELELDEAKQKTKLENEKKQSEAAMKLQENAFEMDQKFIKALDKLETKFLDERTEKQLKAAEEVAKKQEELARDINRSLTDALLRGFESGKDFAQNFKDTLINMFQTLILRPVISAVIDGSGITKLISGLSGGLASLFSGGANAGGLINNILPSGGASGGGLSSIGGLGQLFSGVKSLFSNTTASLISGIEGFGASIANGLGGIRDTVGGFIGANAGAIAQTLPYAGALLQLAQGNFKGAAFQAAGVAIGNAIFPVVGGVIGGIIGSFLGGLGGKDYKRYGTSVSGVKVGDSKFKQTGTGVIYDRKIAGVESSLGNINESFSNTLSTLFKAFDISSTIGTTSGLYQRGKSKKSGGIFDATIDGNAIGRVDVVLKKANMEQVYNALVEKVFGEGLVKAIQASQLSSGIKSLFEGMTKKEQVAGLITATMNLQSAQEELASRFGITVDQSAQAAKATGLVGDALVGYVNKLATASIAFRSIGDSLIGTKSGILDVIGNSLGTVTTEAVTKLVARQVQVAAPATQQRGFGMGGFTIGGNGSSLMDFVRPMQTITKTVYESVTEYVDTITPVTATLPTTLKGFDDLLKSINKNSAAGIKQFNDLFAIRDQFIQFTQAIDGLKGNVRGALFGMVSDAEKQQMLNEDLAKLFGDLGRTVPGSIDELIALGKSIDYTTAEGLNLASVFPALVQAFNATQQAVDSLINSLRDANSFKTLIDFQRYTGVANNYGTSFANSYVDNLPSYDVGTSFVPNDGPAMIHRGERILTASENRDMSSINNAMVSELRALRSEVSQLRVSSEKTAIHAKRGADVLVNVSPNGDTLQMETA